MRASNVTELDRNPVHRAEVNPNWIKYAARIFAGRGANAETVDVVVVVSDGSTVRGWTAEGVYVEVRNVRGQTMLDALDDESEA